MAAWRRHRSGFMAIDNFMNPKYVGFIEEMFKEISRNIIAEVNVDLNRAYVFGTKVAVNENQYNRDSLTLQSRVCLASAGPLPEPESFGDKKRAFFRASFLCICICEDYVGNIFADKRSYFCCP